MFDNLKYLTIADRVGLFLIVPLLLTYVLVNLFSSDDSWPPNEPISEPSIEPAPPSDPEPLPLANDESIISPVHSDHLSTDEVTVVEEEPEDALDSPAPRYWSNCMGEFHPSSMYFGSKAWQNTEPAETPAIPNDKP